MFIECLISVLFNFIPLHQTVLTITVTVRMAQIYPNMHYMTYVVMVFIVFCVFISSQYKVHMELVCIL